MKAYFDELTIQQDRAKYDVWRIVYPPWSCQTFKDKSSYLT